MPTRTNRRCTASGSWRAEGTKIQLNRILKFFKYRNELCLVQKRSTNRPRVHPFNALGGNRRQRGQRRQGLTGCVQLQGSANKHQIEHLKILLLICKLKLNKQHKAAPGHAFAAASSSSAYLRTKRRLQQQPLQFCS